MSLTTVAAVKTFIGITGTADDSFFDILLPAIEASVKHYLDRDIEQATYADYYGGNGTTVLVLNEWPVVSVSEVREDTTGGAGTVSGSFGSTTVLTSGVDYYLNKDGRNGLAEVGRLIRMNGCVWPCRFDYKAGLLTPIARPGVANIKVTYVAGYAAGSIPRDLQLAIWQLCAQVRQMRKRGAPYDSESLAEYSYHLQGLAQDALTLGTAKQLLSRFRRVRQRHKVLT